MEVEWAPATRLAELTARWPEKLVDRIKHDDWVLVVGAGISRQASNGTAGPSSWTGLIQDLSERFTDGSSKASVEGLLKLQQLIDAAELVKQLAIESGKENDFLEALRNATDGPRGNPFKPSKIHSTLIGELAPQIIVTTNYDKLIERASEDAYNVHRPGDANLGTDIRTGAPALIKSHGTVDDLTNIVLTRSDYAAIRHRASELYRVMEALFLTKTCLFVGYSFQDPDLTLLLENSFASKGRPGAHYWLAPDNAPVYLKRFFREHYGVQILPYSTADAHREMNAMLNALSLMVSGPRG